MKVKDLCFLVGGDVVICDSETLLPLTPAKPIANHRFTSYWECEIDHIQADYDRDFLVKYYPESVYCLKQTIEIYVIEKAD